MYRFGPFRADRAAYRVFEGDRPLDLTPKLLDLLFYLLERPATLVTKEELLEGVWPGANVTDNALAQAMSDLRDALGDSASSPTYIRTVARRGYRFVGNVRAEAAPEAETPAPGAAFATARHSSDTRQSIAVLDFTNVTGGDDVAWLSAGIAETVTNDLTALGDFHVIDRWRVLQASRTAGASSREIGASLGVGLLVSGSYQRSGPNLRITARVVDVQSGRSVADAKVDGLLEDVFSLQDSIVAAFARDLGVSPSATARNGVRETSSLEAYRSHTEGWLKIESLDTDLVSASIRDFERAISLDPGYALAYTGLANAEFVAYEVTRAMRTPNLRALASGVDHAKRAIHLDDHLAEAHATLSFLFVSGMRFDEARAAAQRAIQLEPDSWRHHYRLGHASWGTARIRALERAIAIYPQFPYAHFEIAMVHVVRGRLDLAEQIARQGIGEQDRQAQSGHRFPAIGFHWLVGAFAAASGAVTQATEQFDRELAQVDRRRLYGPEYGALALVARGHAELALDDPHRALASFREALGFIPGHPRAIVGEAAALERAGDRQAAHEAWRRSGAARALLESTGRAHEAALAGAAESALRGDEAAAVAGLERYLELLPPSYLGWTIPIDPSFRYLQGHQGFTGVLSRLSDRSR